MDGCMRTREILKSLGIVRQIGLVVPLTKDLPHYIVYYLEGTLYLGKTRNKVLLLDLVQKLSIDVWPYLHVKLCGLNKSFQELKFCKNE